MGCCLLIWLLWLELEGKRRLAAAGTGRPNSVRESLIGQNFRIGDWKEREWKNEGTHKCPCLGACLREGENFVDPFAWLLILFLVIGF